MSNGSGKSFEEEGQEATRRASSSWGWNIFGSSTKAPSKSNGTDPTTLPTPKRLPRFDLSTPSSSAAAPTASNGYPPSFSVDSFGVSMPAETPAATDSKPAASTTFPASRAASAGGYNSRTPSSLHSERNITRGVTGTSRQKRNVQSPWKPPAEGDYPRGLVASNMDQSTPKITPITIDPSKRRYYSSKAPLLIQKNYSRGKKRPLEDPALFQRVLKDPGVQDLFRRSMNGGTPAQPARTPKNYDRFLPKRALGVNQTGSRVPLFGSNNQDDEDDEETYDGPPNKSRKVTFDESGGRTYSEHSWRARKTPMPKSKRQHDHSTPLRSHGDNDEDGDNDASDGLRPHDDVDIAPFAHYSFLPPFNFRSTGRAVPLDYLGEDEAFFSCVVSGVSEVEPHLYPPNNVLAIDTYDVDEYLKKRLEAAIEARKQDENYKLVNAPIEGEPWICQYCHEKTPHDESFCAHCKKYPVSDENKGGWGSDVFAKANQFKEPGTWQCAKCGLYTKQEFAKCVSCQAPRPPPETDAAVSDASTGSSAAPASNSIPSSTALFGTMAQPSASAGSSAVAGFLFSKPPPSSGTATEFKFGYNSNSTPSSASNNSNPFSNGAVKEDGTQESAFAPPSGNQEVGNSSSQASAFEVTTTTNVATSTIQFGAPETKTDSSAGDTKTNESASSNQTFPLFGSSVLSQTPLKMNGQAEVSNGTSSSTLNATAQPFLFGLAAGSTSQVTPAFTFGSKSAAPTPSSSLQPLEQDDTNETDRPSRSDDRSKRMRASQDGENDENDSKLQFVATPTPAPPSFSFGKQTTPAEASNENESIATTSTAAAPGSLFGIPPFATEAMFGTPAPKNDVAGTPSLSSSLKPFSFPASNSSDFSGTSATQGFAPNSSTAAAAAAEPPISAGVSTFGGTTPAPGAFSFGNPSGSGGMSSTPPPATAGFGSMGGANPASVLPVTSFFGGTASSIPATTFGSGSLNTSSTPSSFGFASTPAAPNFGTAPDPFASRTSNTGFAPAQSFGGMTPIVPTAGPISFGAAGAAPAVSAFGGAPSIGSFGAPPATAGPPAFGGSVGGFSVQQAGDINFSIGTSSGPIKGRRMIRAKRPAGTR